VPEPGRQLPLFAHGPPNQDLILRSAVNPTDTANAADPTRADALSRRAQELLAAAKPAEAARLFRAAIAANEKHAAAYYGLVRALRDAGRIEASIGAALALAVLTPDDPLAHGELSISLRAGGHIREAEAAAARARALAWTNRLQSPPPDRQP